MEVDNNLLPKYIAIEGPIGVGKTTLCHKLASEFNYETLLESAIENPFLENFYQQPRQFAFSAQLQFLINRVQQLQQLKQTDLFQPIKVADFIIEKDRLFAQLNLDDKEYQLYDSIYQHLTIEAPSPDLIIYLQAPVEILLNRIKKRNIRFEQRIQPDYLDTLNEAYAKFFHFYKGSPVLIVNAAEIDFANNEDDLRQLINYIRKNYAEKNHLENHLRKQIGGLQYFNPRAFES